MPSRGVVLLHSTHVHRGQCLLRLLELQAKVLRALHVDTSTWDKATIA
jgi:hypothetical protein